MGFMLRFLIIWGKEFIIDNINEAFGMVEVTMEEKNRGRSLFL